MLYGDAVKNDYFDWMVNLVCGNRYAKSISYRKLLTRLHDIEFTYIIPRDSNRAEDGVSLRYRFAYSNGDSEAEIYLKGPCSVLEMMVALAIKCEESIMDDPRFGDRTSQWFWGMINNLGLGGMTDDRFDRYFVDEVIGRFLDRDYEPNGRGGLFTVRNASKDLRDVEIWYQLCWYLDTIV